MILWRNKFYKIIAIKENGAYSIYQKNKKIFGINFDLQLIKSGLTLAEVKKIKKDIEEVEKRRIAESI